VIYAALGLVALIAVAMRAAGVEQMPALQNLYLIPVLWAAFARGTLGGILAGLEAGSGCLGPPWAACSRFRPRSAWG